MSMFKLSVVIEGLKSDPDTGEQRALAFERWCRDNKLVVFEHGRELIKDPLMHIERFDYEHPRSGASDKSQEPLSC